MAEMLGVSEGTVRNDLNALAERGQLTRVRAHLVKEDALARIARRIGLGQAIRLGEGELRGGGSDRASILADPERLGRLWWLTLSTPDLPEPRWVHSARSRDRTDV